MAIKEQTPDCTTSRVKELDYDTNQWIYEQTPDKLYRYTLGTKGVRPLICFGINPSTASPHNLDPTVRNVEAFAKICGYDSFIMLNLYPMRATNPNAMDKEANLIEIEKNLQAMERIFALGNCDIWAAWGTLITKRPYLKDCLRDIVALTKKYNCNWITIGSRSKAGHPHHPLYLNRENRPVAFDIEDYLQTL